MLREAFKSLPASRREARKLGADRFFTGKACGNGHIAPRYIGGNCVECQVEHARKYGGWNIRPSKAEFLRRARKLVEARGGALLDAEYISAKSMLRVRCSRGHKFKISYDHLKRLNWCRHCGNEASAAKRIRYTVKQLQKWAFRKYGGSCLAKNQVNMHTKVLWKCSSRKHKPFESTISSVMHSDSWCPACYNDRREPPQPPIPRKRVEEIIRERGGKIIESLGKWKGTKTRIRLRCANGHTWPADVANLVYAHSWFPECRNKGERVVRAIFETTFAAAFPKRRPKWLLSEVGHRLELDGYNERLRLAFEYQGPHHYSDERVQSRDAIKLRRCRMRNICLVVIEATKYPFPPENVLKNVAEGFRRAGLYKETPLLPSLEMFPDELVQLQHLAEKNKGVLISKRYGGNEQHEWKCANPEHPSWMALPSNIRKGSWCSYCAENHSLGVNGLESWGRRHGLKLLDSEYRGTMQIYSWQCRQAGHVIRRSKSNIEQSVAKGVAACSVCAGTSRVTIDEIRGSLARRGWKVVSEAYRNAAVPLLLICRHGHAFRRSWNRVQQGKGCRVKGCPDAKMFSRLNRAVNG